MVKRFREKLGELELPPREVMAFGIFFASLQILDGVLTAVGVTRYGIEHEGNWFFRALLRGKDPVQEIALLKAFAVITIVYLTILARRLTWVKDVISVLCCLYLFAAIIPWLFILV